MGLNFGVGGSAWEDSRIDLSATSGGHHFSDAPHSYASFPGWYWLVIGQDTDPWVPSGLGGTDPSRYQSGADLTLNADGIHIDVGSVDVTLLVRFAFQISVVEASTNLYVAPADCLTNGRASGFSGLINGDGDPLSIAANAGNGDYIGQYTWRVAAGSQLAFAVSAGPTETLDGAEVDIVRVA